MRAIFYLSHFNSFFPSFSLQKLILSDGGEIFNLWKTPPVDLYVKIYLFNVTNHKEFLAGKEKLNVQEIGPYVYKYVSGCLISVILREFR